MKISKIYLYDAPSVPKLKIQDLKHFLKNEFGFDVEVRKNIFQNFSESTASQMAQCRVINTKKPFVFHSPSPEEISFEKNSFRDLIQKENLILYDGFEFQKVIKSLLSDEENTKEKFHAVFTDKLTCTFDYNDYRYHGRAVICSNPSIISITGMIEAPAKPKEYYLELMTKMSLGLNLESLKKKYSGTYLEYHDERISKIAEGYLLQAICYYVSGEPFCNSKDCRLYNAHWQQDLIHSQIDVGQLCGRHQKILNNLNY